jgi:hypothetical protein
LLFATVRQRKIHVKKPDTVIQNGVNVDWLKLEMDDEWAEMDSIVCVFVNQYTEEADGKLEKKEVSRQMLHTFGKDVRVPWECLEKTGMLSVSCTGYVDGEKVMTTMYPDSYWNVVQNGPVTGGETLEPTPSLYNQILAAAGEATAAAIAANQAKDQLLQDKANGLFDGADGKNAKVSVGSTQTGNPGSEASVYATGTPQDLILNFVLPRGRDGEPGQAGPAGNDGYTPVKGKDYFDGKDGQDGKDGYSPVKGVDYFDGKDGTDGYTPVKGKDYFDGQDGYTPRKGIDYFDGTNGKDGVGIKSIVFKESNNTGYVYTVNLTDNTSYEITAPRGPQGTGGGGGSGEAGADGVGIQSIQLKKEAATGNTYTILLTDGSSYDFVAPAGPAGKDGTDGSNGKDGTSVTVSSVTESTADGGTNVVTFSDGKKLNVKNGSKGSTGSPGANGKDGKTPVRGTDYWTEEDIAEIKGYVDDAILNGAW